MITIPEKYFLYINIGVIVLFLLNIFISYKKGFLYSVIKILFAIGAIFVAYKCCTFLAKLYPLLKDFLNNKFSFAKDLNINLDYIANCIIYFIIVFVLIKILAVLITPLFKKVSDIPIVGWINKIGGIVIGLFNATITMIVLSLLLSLPIIANNDEIKEKTLFKFADKGQQLLVNVAKDIFNDIDLKDLSEKFKIETKNEKKFDLNNDLPDDFDRNTLLKYLDLNNLPSDISLNDLIKGFEVNNLDSDFDLNTLNQYINLNELKDKIDLNKLFKNVDINKMIKDLKINNK